MTTEEHLNLIVEKCNDLVSVATEMPIDCSEEIAGWRSTIAAIEEILLARKYSTYQPEKDRTDNTIKAIIAAWPEEILT